VAVCIIISKIKKGVKFKYSIGSYLQNHVNNNLSEKLIIKVNSINNIIKFYIVFFFEY